VPAFEKFQKKYSTYRPYTLRNDAQFSADLVQVKGMMLAVKEAVQTGDLQQAHLDLEKVRPVFQQLFKRNGFSMLAVALVDFHDTMELMLDAANAKNAAQTLALYEQVNAKLQAIEAEANDSEIKAIRFELDTLNALAKENKVDAMPAQSEKLKTSFVKVYLKRG
jgi:type IV secretory pathway VirJ component